VNVARLIDFSQDLTPGGVTKATGLWPHHAIGPLHPTLAKRNRLYPYLLNLTRSSVVSQRLPKSPLSQKTTLMPSVGNQN
jgi:hypothetical protein